MIQGLTSTFRVPDLRRRILFTLAMLAIYRLGAHLPVPGVNTLAVQRALSSQGGALGFFDLLVGGAFTNFALFALGVIPYITSSIIMSLLQIVFPRLKEIATEEGEAGRRLIGRYTLYLTIPLAVLQALAQITIIESIVAQAGVVGGALADGALLTRALIVVTLTAGTMLITWIGEIMTEHGIGNGVSLIIFGGIVARLPQQTVLTVAQVRQGGISPLLAMLDVGVVLASIVGVVAITQAVRKIPVQYAKRVVGRRMYGGQSTHIPLRIVQAGVIPIIFAVSVLQFPQTIANFVRTGWLQTVSQAMSLNRPAGMALYFALIIAFTYFYTAVSFDPNEVSDNIKKYGGFIPGIRPGKPTSEFLTRVLERLTFVGALFLGLIAVVPLLLSRSTGVFTFYLGGTAMLIVVGVALETMKQLEAYVLMRHYEGFMR